MDNTHNFIDSNYLHDTPQSEVQRNKNSRRGRSGEGSAPGIAHKLFVTALFLLPFIFVPVAGWSVTVGKVVITALLTMSAGATVFAAVRNRTLEMPKIYSMLTLGALVLVTLSTVFSYSRTASVFGTGLEVGTFFTTAVGLGIAFVAPLVLTSSKRLVTALMALLAGGGVLALFHLIRLVFGVEVLSFGYFAQATSTPVGSWNDLGIFFGATYLIALVTIVLGGFPKRLKMVLGAVLGISLVFIALVNFQLLSIVLALTTLAFLGVTFVIKHNQGFATLATASVFLVLISIFSSPLSVLTGQLFNTSYAEIRPNWSSTQEMLSAGLADGKNIFLGMGPNTFTYLWQQERASEVTETGFWAIDFSFATGIIPTFAVTFGLVATATLVTLAVYLVLRLFGVFIARGEEPLLSTVALASGVAAVFLWILSVLYVFSVAIFFLMFTLTGVAVAALMQMNRVTTFSIDSNTQSGPLVGLVGAVICVALVVPALLVSTSRTLYGQGVVEANTAEEVEGIANAQAKIRQASILENNDAFARTETELGLVRIQEILSRENLDEAQRPEVQEISLTTQEAATRATTTNPQNYLNWVNSGLVYETLGLLEVENAFELAASSYARAQALNPTNPELPLIQARFERVREDVEAAIAYAEEAIAIKSNYEDAYLFLADMELAEEDIVGAVARLEEGIEVAPESTALNYQLGLIHYSEENYSSAIESFTRAILIDPQYANARYFRALSYIYGENDQEEALQDLNVVLNNNPDNEVVATVITNVEAGNDPLEGVAEDDPALPPVDGEGSIETNAEAIEELEVESDPQNQSESIEVTPESDVDTQLDD